MEQLHQVALQVTENYFAEHASELADILRQEAKSRESVLNVFKSLGYEIEL